MKFNQTVQDSSSRDSADLEGVLAFGDSEVGDSRFMGELEELALPLRRAILAHPFVSGVGDGSLPVERFKYFIAQDYVYLIDYARALAVASARAPELAVMSWFAGLLDETLNTEMALHRSYCAEFGITAQELAETQAAPTTVAYTSYLLKTANQGSFGELCASLMPCQWGYWEIGEHLAAKGEPVGAPLYAQWVRMYSTTEFRDLAAYLRTLTGRLGDEAPPGERHAMERAYLTSLRLEYRFWDMAYNMEQWGI